MKTRLDFSTQSCIKEIENVIKDRSKRIVYNKKDHFFEVIFIQDDLSCDQTEDKEVLKEKIQGLAGTIHLRLEDIKIILAALRDRINKDKKKKYWFFNNYLKTRSFNRKNSLEIYQFFEKVFSQIVQQSISNVSESSKNLFLQNKKYSLNNKFLKLKDFQHTFNSYEEYVSEKKEENNFEKVETINNVSYAHILNNVSEDLYLLSKDDILIYENFRKNILNDNFPRKQFFSEKENINIFEYNPSIEELNIDIKNFLEENFYDFAFILKFLLRIFLRKDKEDINLLVSKTNSAKIQWFLHKIQLISQNEDAIFFNMIAALLSPIKGILERPSVLKQERIKQNLQEEIISLKKKIISLKALSYIHWEICILNLFEEWIFDNQELLKNSLINLKEEKKRTSLISFFKDFLKKKN